MALTNKLSAIGDAIRAKTGKTALLSLDDMPTEIRAISGGGGGPTAEQLTFRGDISYLFRSGNWDWAIEAYGNLMTTNDITKISYAFTNSNIKKIPFTLNFKAGSSYHDSSSTFTSMPYLTELPTVVNYRPNELTFEGNGELRYIPDEWLDSIDWGYIDSITATYTQPIKNPIARCFSLRNFPSKMCNHANQKVTNSYNCIYNSLCNQCYNLDEATDIPVWTGTLTSNTFSNSFSSCFRLKNVTFATNEDGTPKVANWKSQTIALGDPGSFPSIYDSTFQRSYLKNSGITMDKEVNDDATYQALKDDPDWWYRNVSGQINLEGYYSRYNHDSAVATINSLPDTSAYLAANGGTNTIQFRHTAGAGTDGGAINTLTEEEIAVATAKGWTVTLT